MIGSFGYGSMTGGLIGSFGYGTVTGAPSELSYVTALQRYDSTRPASQAWASTSPAVQGYDLP